MAEGSCTVELSLESKKDFKVVKQIIEKIVTSGQVGLLLISVNIII